MPTGNQAPTKRYDPLCSNPPPLVFPVTRSGASHHRPTPPAPLSRQIPYPTSLFGSTQRQAGGERDREGERWVMRGGVSAYSLCYPSKLSAPTPPPTTHLVRVSGPGGGRDSREKSTRLSLCVLSIRRITYRLLSLGTPPHSAVVLGCFVCRQAQANTGATHRASSGRQPAIKHGPATLNAAARRAASAGGEPRTTCQQRVNKHRGPATAWLGRAGCAGGGATHLPPSRPMATGTRHNQCVD